MELSDPVLFLLVILALIVLTVVTVLGGVWITVNNYRHNQSMLRFNKSIRDVKKFASENFN